jgi:hypothetical protein
MGLKCGNQGKEPLGRHRRRWEDTIKMDLQEIGCNGLGWINLSQEWDIWRVPVNAALKIRVP